MVSELTVTEHEETISDLSRSSEDIHEEVSEDVGEDVGDGKPTHSTPNIVSWLDKIEQAIQDDNASELEDLLPIEYIDEIFDVKSRLLPLAAEEGLVICRCTAVVWACAMGSVRIVESLLQRGADVLTAKAAIGLAESVRIRPASAIHLAAMNGHTCILDILLDQNPEFLELRTADGETALFLAAQGGSASAITYLLGMGADPAATQLFKRTALHEACTRGHAEVCQALLKGILRSEEPNGGAVAKAVITARDYKNRTALNEAALRGHTEIALHLLETPVYFPRTFFTDEVIRANTSYEEEYLVHILLDEWMNTAKEAEILRHGAAVCYWAILHECLYFLALCHRVSPNREEASWVHVAAIGGSVSIMQRFLKEGGDILASGRAGIRPLHLAAAHGHYALVKEVLLPSLYSTCEKNFYHPLEMLLLPAEGEITAVEFAAFGGTGRQDEVERLLWSEVHRLVSEQDEHEVHGFIRGQPEMATKVLELAARCETPGKEDNLHRFFRMISPHFRHFYISELGLEPGRNALHWAIAYQEPTLVWWLLANGAYLNDSDINHGITINERVKEHAFAPVLTQVNTMIQELLSDSPPIPNHPVLRGDNNAPVFRSEPKEYGNAQAVITDFYKVKDRFTFQPKRRQIRDIIYEELMVRLARDQGLKARDHRPSAQFVRDSCIQLPAGGKKFYVKPQCVMPYLSWMEWQPRKPQATLDSTSDQRDEVSVDPIHHEPLTLDQYYYVSLDDTEDRDKTQVLGRYIRREEERAENAKPNGLPSDSKGPSKANSVLPKKVASKQSHRLDLLQPETPDPILSVGQLWLWILDGNTIITCTAKEPPGAEKSFLKRVLDRLDIRNKESAMSAKSMAELIASTAVELLNEKHIPILGNKVSPLEVFRASIGYVRNSEADLFRKFQASLEDESKAEAMAKPGVKTTDLDEYHNIATETDLLQEVKDICDELNILKTLAEDQEHVWRQTSDLLGDNKTTFSNDAPAEVKKTIIGMIHDAEVVQKSIDTLLDLKQKQANLTEAQWTRRQAQDTAKQTDTVVWFTVVTIIFLPLSFLTSLFALNVSSFPHEGGEVSYQGWWIFPIIFGVSTVVSAFFLSIAFKAYSLKQHFTDIWEHSKSEVKKVFTWGDPPKSAPEDEKV
ncbi:hypothetical protein HFD88_008883 [Aspergillus terreus]|nr:hypothetical protein HFD88_008883 [Aspergillus terreus]